MESSTIGENEECGSILQPTRAQKTKQPTIKCASIKFLDSFLLSREIIENFFSVETLPSLRVAEERFVILLKYLYLEFKQDGTATAFS